MNYELAYVRPIQSFNWFIGFSSPCIIKLTYLVAKLLIY